MESRIICVIDKYISFLFGNRNEKDPEQKMYNKLLQLEGEELEDWVNTKLKNYIIVAGYACSYEGDDFEGIGGATIMDTWYHNEILQDIDDILRFDEIYSDNKEELQIIKEKLYIFYRGQPREYIRNLNWRMDIISDYKDLYIMNMSTIELKSYIIQIME
jgi:hypothetical protein